MMMTTLHLFSVGLYQRNFFAMFSSVTSGTEQKKRKEKMGNRGHKWVLMSYAGAKWILPVVSLVSRLLSWIFVAALVVARHRSLDSAFPATPKSSKHGPVERHLNFADVFSPLPMDRLRQLPLYRQLCWKSTHQFNAFWDSFRKFTQIIRSASNRLLLDRKSRMDNVNIWERYSILVWKRSVEKFRREIISARLTFMCSQRQIVIRMFQLIHMKISITNFLNPHELDRAGIFNHNSFLIFQ